MLNPNPGNGLERTPKAVAIHPLSPRWQLLSKLDQGTLHPMNKSLFEINQLYVPIWMTLLTQGHGSWAGYGETGRAGHMLTQEEGKTQGILTMTGQLPWTTMPWPKALGCYNPGCKYPTTLLDMAKRLFHLSQCISSTELHSNLVLLWLAFANSLLSFLLGLGQSIGITTVCISW